MAVLKSARDYQKEYQKFKKDKRKADMQIPSGTDKTPSHEPPKFVRKEEAEKEYVHLTVEVKPIVLERLVWLTIIAALVIVIFYNPYSDYLDWKKGVMTGEIKGTVQEINAANSQTSESAVQSTSSEATGIAESGIQQDDDSVLDNLQEVDSLGNKDIASEVVVQNMKITADDVTLTILDVGYEDKGDYAKVNSVKIRAETTGVTLYPEFSVIIYDAKTEQFDKERVRGTALFDIGISSSQELEISLDSHPTFRDKSSPITVLVILENSRTGDILARTTKQFTLNY